MYLDVTKAYDNAWVGAIMYGVYKEGLNCKLWHTTKSLNEHVTAQINTKYGLTRKININDSIRKEEFYKY